MSYASDELMGQLERGPQTEEGFFRIKVTGSGETHWVNITPAQLAGFISVLEHFDREDERG